MNEVVMEVNTLADTVYQASEKLGENSYATEATATRTWRKAAVKAVLDDNRLWGV